LGNDTIASRPTRSIERAVLEAGEPAFEVALDHVDAVRHARGNAGVGDLDAVAARVADAGEECEQAAVGAAQVEHRRSGFDPSRDRRVVRAPGRRDRRGLGRADDDRRGLACDSIEVGAHHCVVLRVVQQERVVPVRCRHLGVRDVASVMDERLHDLPGARRREAPVRRERDDQEATASRRQRLREVAAGRARRIEVVERLGDPQVGVRVVVLGELLALVAQVGLDLELGRERELQPVAQLAAELGVHLLVGQVGDVADHAGDAQAPPRLRAGAHEVPVVEVGIGQDRLPRDLVERDVLGRQVGRGRDHDRVAEAVRIADRPGERLHAAEAAAHHRRPGADAEPVGEPRLRVDPVLDGDEREVRAPRRPGLRMDRRRPARAEAASEVVDADDEEAVGVERLARAHHVVPPADVALVAFVPAGDVMRGVERVADEHRVARVGVQRAVGLVGELEPRQRAAAGERERLVETLTALDDRPDGAAARRRRVGSGGGFGKGGQGCARAMDPASLEG